MIWKIFILKNIRFPIFVAILSLFASVVYSEEYSLKYCLEKVIENSEYNKQIKYIENISANDNNNINSIYLPQIKAEVQASYQSDVFKLNTSIPIPGFSIPSPPKEQYRLNLSIIQNIFDGGYSNAAKQSNSSEFEIKKINIQISNQKLQETIVDYYFSILLIQDAVKSINNMQKNLQVKRQQVQSLVRNGVVLQSSLNSIDIELLLLEQKIEEASDNIISIQKMIAIWIEDENVINSTFVLPEKLEISDDWKILRPEYFLFENKKELLDNKKEEVKSKILPIISAFVNGGYGNPNPNNMMKETGDFFYTAGIKFQWNVFDWGNNTRSRENLEISKSLIQIEKALFDKQFKNSIVSLRQDIEKYSSLSIQDKSILELQKKNCDNSFSQFSNGSATISEYLIEMNKQTQYEINYYTHQVQIQAATIKYLIKIGNY